jgi:CMP-N,N'-diacetyllegionaminic acid synthase
MIAIIPAREGSKGLPRKNIRPLNGKPLIAYTIETALKAKSISEVIISTDSKEIAKIAVTHGALCPFMRPNYLATDDSIAIDTYLYTINRLEKEREISIPGFIVLLPTSPLRIISDIENAVNMFHENNADSVISFTEESHPVSWHMNLNKDNSLVNIFEVKMENRQNYSKTYYPNGSIFIFTKELLLHGTYYSNKTYAYIMPRERSVDIDSELDFKFAEFMMKNNEKY